MSTHSGEIQNTYVQLITAPSSGANGTVKFHAQMTDASGGDFNKWGFFYKKSTTDVAVHTGNTIAGPDGIVADNPQTLPGSDDDVWFTRDAVVNAGRGDKYYFNAYLHDTNGQSPGAEYIFQNPTNEETAPTGTSFIIPNVDQDAATIDTPFQVTLNGKLEEDLYSNAFPFVEAGFDYKRDGDDWSAAITEGSASWDEGTATWTKTVQDLSNNQQYESRAWLKVKDRVATAPQVGAADILIRGYESDDSQNETKTWTTQDHEVPEIEGSHHESGSVRVDFYPDRDKISDDNRYASAQDPTKPMEMHFEAELKKVGVSPTTSTAVGFFVSDTTDKPNHNNKTQDINGTTFVPPGGVADGVVFSNTPTTESALVNFPIPGKSYRVNPYAKHAPYLSNEYYYPGAESSWPPTGVQFQIPKVHEPTVPGKVVEITDAKTDGTGEATFDMRIVSTLIYPGRVSSASDKKGFYWWSKTGADAAKAHASWGGGAEYIYPGYEAIVEDYGPGDDEPDDGPQVVQTSWNPNSTAATHTETVNNLKWGTRYYVRPFVLDDMSPGLKRIFYATKTAADSCEWQPARSFYIPSVVTPLSATGTASDTTFVLPALSLEDPTGYYNGEGGTTGADASPQIYQKGYYLKQSTLSPSFSVGDRYATAPWPKTNTTAEWGSITFEGLTPGEVVYWYQPYALVKRYVGAGTAAGDLFEISGNTIQSFATLKPLIVENTPATPPFIEVGAGTSTGMGEGKKFRNITVTGELVDSGGGTSAVAEIGFFLSSANDSPNFSSHQDKYSLQPVPSLEDPSDRELKTPATAGATQTNAILYVPGTTYYVNFYGSPVVSGASPNDYYYDGGQANPPDPAPDFQIPDIRNSYFEFDSTNGEVVTSIKLRAVVIEGDNTTNSNYPTPMTPAETGFVYSSTTVQSGVFPHQGTTPATDILTIVGTPAWSNLVEDNPGEEVFGDDFEYTLNTALTNNVWPPTPTLVYHVNGFLKDTNGTIYYPLTDQHSSFVIPDPHTPAEYFTNTESTTITLHGELDGLFVDTFPRIKEYGFISKADVGDNSWDEGEEKPKTGGDGDAFECDVTGLTGNTTYSFRVYVKMYKNGTSGDTFNIESDTTKTFTTKPDFGTVANVDPEFLTNYKIKLNGNVIGLGGGAQESTAMGFFISDINTNPGVDEYNASPPDPSFNDTHEVTPIGTGSFFIELSFNSFGTTLQSAKAGQIYYINAWVNDPTFSDDNGTPNEKSGFRYHGGGNTAPAGVSITLPNIVAHPSQLPPNMLVALGFNVELFGRLDVQPKIGTSIASGAKKGFFWHTAQGPGNGVGTKVEHANTNEGDYSDIVTGVASNTDYYFNGYAYDGKNYYYKGTGATPTTYPAFAHANRPNGDEFKLPEVTISGITDVSGDAVRINASNGVLTNFTIQKVGLYLEGVSQAEEDPADGGGPNTWEITKGPPLDTDFDKLGGNKPYSAQAFIRINNHEITSSPATFTTHEWPHIIYKDISRNVTSDEDNNTGFILMTTEFIGHGASNASISTAKGSMIGFYIKDASNVRSGEWPDINRFEELEQDTSYNHIRTSRADVDPTYLDRGKLYYSNTYASQKNPPPDNGVSDPTNYQYYGFFNTKNNTTDASCTTLARANAGGVAGGIFPDGISFIIPKISNKNPEIIDSSTVKLNLHIDSSGDTVDVSGTNRLGFFLNHSTESWADASCNEEAYQVGYTPDLDLPTISTPESDIRLEDGGLPPTGGSSSHLLKNPHIFTSITNLSPATYRKLIINVSSWRVLITPDASGCCGTTPTHGVDERVEATGGAVDLVNPFEVEVRWDGGAWHDCTHIVSASGEVWNDASNGIWYAARIVGNSFWEIDAEDAAGDIDVKVEWNPTDPDFATFFDTINDPSLNSALGLSDNNLPWDQTNNPPFRVTSAKVIVTTIENVPLVEVENGILETTKTLSVEDSSVILSSITYSNDNVPDATWTGLDEQAELDQVPPNDGYNIKHTHSYAHKIFASGSSVDFGLGSTPSTEPGTPPDIDASACIYVYFKNSDTPITVRDISKVLIPEMDPWSPTSTNKINNDYFLDASGLIAGRNYYYTGYTALLSDDHDGYDKNDEPLRGESVDGDDYWYPPKYISEDSTNIVKSFCIGDSSCNNLSSAAGTKTDTTTKLQGKTLGDPPNPYNNEYGFVYWFDGSNNYDNRKSGPGALPTSAWPTIELTGLKDSTRYYALPYFKQGDNYIYGGFDRTTQENKPRVWYTDLTLCGVSLNDISGVEFGNDNGGSSTGEGTGGLTDDDSGSQTRYKLVGIDASLNTNPPNNFEAEAAPNWPTDTSGTVVELGLCWKVTDYPEDEAQKATVADFFKNILYDSSKNGTINGGVKVFEDASCNIYDASINDLSYNTMYSLRTYAKNIPFIDSNLGSEAQQVGGGYAYSTGDSFITPLPKVLIEDPSAAQFPLENDVNPFATYAPNIFTKIGISGEILDNPDEASGNIIEYGFLFKMFDVEEQGPTTISYDDFNNETCDISTNLLGGGENYDIFYPDNLADTSFNIADSSSVPYKFFQSLSLYPKDDGGGLMVKDLSYNRQYYFGSYARNMSDYYLKKGLNVPYINIDGITSYKKFNDSSGVFITPWPDPYIQILDLEKPSNLNSGSLYTFINVSLEIFNYDPTRWGGIVEFGVIWEKNKKLKESNIDPDNFTTQYMDCSGAWVGEDGSGGWYRRGCSGEAVGNDFGEPVDGSRNGGWFWDEFGPEKEGAGWQYDASFSTGGFPDGGDNTSCRWPPVADTYVKLGVYKLGLGGDVQSTENIYPSGLIDHKPGPFPLGSAQDPSSIPFNTEESYWLRPYIITRNKGFWIPPDENGNPRNDDILTYPHPDSSFNVFWGPPKNLTFDLDLVDVRTGHTGEDINWFTRGYTGNGSETWPSMLDPGIDSADMSGNIMLNPILGNPIRGRIIKYGFLWWDGGKTASEGAGALQWPGMSFGFGPETAAGGSIPNLGFTLANTTWPPDGSNNYCVPMDPSSQDINFGWNAEANGRTTYDISGTNFDISANDPVRGGRDIGGAVGEGYGEGGISNAAEHGYYWNSTPGVENDGWYKLAFPRNNPPWPGSLWDSTTRSWSAKTGPRGEAAVIHSQHVIFDVKKTSRPDTEDRRLFNSTVWYRAYAINRYFDPESGEEPQTGIAYGSVGRLELKKSVNFGVDMINPVLISSNIGTRSILVRGTLLGNMDGQGSPIVENYGFCWRKLVENHAQDEHGNPIPDSEREPTWYYDVVSKSWVNEPESYPPPTVIDSSMVALGIRAEDTSGAGFIWSDEFGIEQYPLSVNDPSNQEVAEFDPSGEFPGEIANSAFPGFTQNPPAFKFGEREWSFHYKIGSDGEELEAEGGIKDPNFVGFDASGGKLNSNTYYLIRAWVKGPIDPGTAEQDNGESASGIKYGPIWYISSEVQEENKKRGWLVLTRPLELCSLDLITTINLTYKSVILRSKLLTNPNPTKLNKYGFVYMLDDASGNGLPTLEDNAYVLLKLPTNLNDIAAPPPKIMEKKISILPNSYYTIRAFADNSFESYISYDSSGNPEGSSTIEGGIAYSDPYTLLSDFCPPPVSKIISATNVSYTSVQLRGEIFSNFNGLITEHGFIVGEKSTPIINDGSSNKYDLGSKNNLGDYTYFATDLKYNTTYFVRSFAYHPGAHEDLRLHYGSLILTFQTLNPDPPEIASTQQMPNGRASFSATFSAEIKDTSGIELLSSYGFCWTTRVVPLSGKAEYLGDTEPPDNELKIENADNYSVYTNIPVSFPFFFETVLTNLQPSTTYYIRSYAKINPIGYGQVFTFTTLDEPCECIPVTAKPIGALHPNKSSKMLCAEAIKRRGSAIIGTRGVTPNLL